MTSGARLKEERRRLRLKQAEFADLVGTDVPKQSLYENDKRQLRGAYLERIAAAGVDVLYVITGRRSESALLGDDVTAFIAAWLSLPPGAREIVQRVVTDLSRYLEGGGRGGES
jgi:transcriptional regulator with XRE-family HTH domain